MRWTQRLAGTGEVHVAFRFGVLAVSARGAALYRLDYATGTMLWAVTTASAGRATILVEHDMIVVAKGGHLDAVTHQGTRLWARELSDTGFAAVALATPGNVAQADAQAAR